MDLDILWRIPNLLRWIISLLMTGPMPSGLPVISYSAGRIRGVRNDRGAGENTSAAGWD